MRKILLATAALLAMSAPAFALSTTTASAGGTANSFAVGALGGSSVASNTSTVNSNAVNAGVGGVGLVGAGVVWGSGNVSNANVTQSSTSVQLSNGAALSGAGGLNFGSATASGFTF